MLTGTLTCHALLSLLMLCEQTRLKEIIQPCHYGVQTIYMPQRLTVTWRLAFLLQLDKLCIGLALEQREYLLSLDFTMQRP